MTMFDSRERAFEGLFARDAEKRFRAKARRARLLGQWAAKQLNKTSDEAADYAQDIVCASLQDGAGQVVRAKLDADLNGYVAKRDLMRKIAHYMEDVHKHERATD